MALPESHFTTAHPARVYDFYLGGKTNYQVDRDAGEQVLAVWPGAQQAAQVNRAFMHRAVRLLCERGIRQFLDIGTGIPTEPNLHQVAQEVDPAARTVYVDKDPLVLVHADALMRSAPEGRTAYLQADVTTDVDRIVAGAAETLDLDEPVALSLIALLHFVPDEQGAYGMVRRLLDALSPGSALVLTHGTGDFDPAVMERVAQIYRGSGIGAQARSREELAAFFDGLDLVPPGIEVPHRWRPDPARVRPRSEEYDAQVAMWAAVGIKR
ncbi:SAM-dependent methyltransferase [Streptomyces radicis]|uniref:SAM-dependent methyltransferase n=1 Tax=Streptomyces radicis TaxID=1750517 RepID=A0A3A9WN64_9ACTN|nr:SAM-dependent methyltransferase [Streptomyces radicis]RKN10904.1 SAM-dependent methyltransferase [Streptomyces radicis]RKN25167.1 SAM-dependent methyltransferase [Streptomyces radicis]